MRINIGKTIKSARKKKEQAKKDIAKSYNEFKEFEGTQYTGMKVGRSHKWYYDKGVWKEKKITPEKWEMSYSVTKRRAGKAPEGSGVPVGTEYHWFILADQNVKKLNANDYSTDMKGFKIKLAHKRFDKETWSASEKAQKKHLIKLFQNMIKELELELVEMEKAKEASKAEKKSLSKKSSKTKEIDTKTTKKSHKKEKILEFA